MPSCLAAVTFARAQECAQARRQLQQERTDSIAVVRSEFETAVVDLRREYAYHAKVRTEAVGEILGEQYNELVAHFEAACKKFETTFWAALGRKADLPTVREQVEKNNKKLENKIAHVAATVTNALDGLYGELNQLREQTRDRSAEVERLTCGS